MQQLFFKQKVTEAEIAERRKVLVKILKSEHRKLRNGFVDKAKDGGPESVPDMEKPVRRRSRRLQNTKDIFMDGISEDSS